LASSDLRNEAFARVFLGESGEDERRQHQTDDGADGGADQAEHQLDVGQQQPHQQRHRHQEQRDALEARFRNVRRPAHDLSVPARNLKTREKSAFKVKAR